MSENHTSVLKVEFLSVRYIQSMSRTAAETLDKELPHCATYALYYLAHAYLTMF